MSLARWSYLSFVWCFFWYWIFSSVTEAAFSLSNGLQIFAVLCVFHLLRAWQNRHLKEHVNFNFKKWSTRQQTVPPTSKQKSTSKTQIEEVIDAEFKEI